MNCNGHTAMDGLNFTQQMRRLCTDIAQRLPRLRHVDTQRVAIRYCQARKAGLDGIQATLTPLRFEGGGLITLRHGRRWTIQRYFDPAGREFLYLLSFYLPRFLQQSMDEKLTTVFHELWHISPAFDGDLRRLPGRCYAHGANERHYDELARQMADAWLAAGPPAALYDFLRYDFDQLRRMHGLVYGTRMATPKLIPIPA